LNRRSLARFRLTMAFDDIPVELAAEVFKNLDYGVDSIQSLDRRLSRSARSSADWCTTVRSKSHRRDRVFRLLCSRPTKEGTFLQWSSRGGAYPTLT